LQVLNLNFYRFFIKNINLLFLIDTYIELDLIEIEIEIVNNN